MGIEIRLFGGELIDSEHMKKSQMPPETVKVIDHIIFENCLPVDSHEDIFNILREPDDDQRQEDLKLYIALYYQMEPNHTRYDKRRDMFPTP